ncbi:hypothetical protein [Pseudoalteromonas tetraodonis]|uniref:hypothetical protein n=1 Tax=Pseudoalteromonas tetraodonis TaxID=43659 RepID=UPI0029A5B33C|nr:hypothetical protein [Pseudoalteromonas tetraodonis]
MSGIKITYAYDNNGKKISAGDYDSTSKVFPLFCPNENCDAQLKYVKGFKRESYGKQQFIPSYFRLEKQHVHAQNCSFATGKQKTLLVADSNAEVKDALAKGELIFRIHVMDSDEQKLIKRNEMRFCLNPPIDTTDRTYSKKGQKSTYVRTMDSLIEIYNYGVINSIARKKIKLIIGGTPVNWEDFFYSTNHLGSLRSKLLNNKIVQAAVIVNIKVIGFPNPKLGGFRFIECRPKTSNTAPNIVTTLKLSKSMKTNIFNIGSKVMILGKFSLPRDSERSIPVSLGNEIRTLVSDEMQVAEF